MHKSKSKSKSIHVQNQKQHCPRTPAASAVARLRGRAPSVCRPSVCGPSVRAPSVRVPLGPFKRRPLAHRCMPARSARAPSHGHAGPVRALVHARAGACARAGGCACAPVLAALRPPHAVAHRAMHIVALVAVTTRRPSRQLCAQNEWHCESGCTERARSQAGRRVPSTWDWAPPSRTCGVEWTARGGR
jgi:hypothetical protein